MGLYTQRKPGIDGGKTAILEPEELDDKYFMLRVRIDGGRLTTDQLRVIGEISQEFARGTADLTDRQNVQYHWIRIEDVPEIWNRLEAVGLSTTEACGDTPRTILGSPVAGIAEDEIIDGSSAIDEIHRLYIGTKEFSNLPRKFKTAISGSPLLDVAHEINDIAFVGVNHPEHGPGFDLWVGGGLSTNPKIGVRLGAWVPLDEVPDVWAGVIGIFRDYGYRRLRTRARLKFLVADWGQEKFRQVLEDEYLKRKLVDGPAPAQPVQRWRDHVGVHRQQDGLFYVGFAPRVGRVDGTTLTKIAELAQSHGSGRLRTTVEQKMIVLDVEEGRIESLVEGLEALGLTAKPSPSGAARWPAPASSTASSRSSRPSSAASRSSTNWSAASRSSTSRSPSTSTAARTPAPVSRSRTSVSRASWSSTTRASRSRASRCTSAAPSVWRPASAARSVA